MEVTAASRLPYSLPRIGRFQFNAAAVLTTAAFLFLFFQPLKLLLMDWWSDPEAGHGLLLGPVAIWLAWKAGLEERATPYPSLGCLILLGAIALRIAAGLAAELFTMRLALVGALLGLTVYFRGPAQVRRWWLPFALFTLCIPLPALLTGAIALPLQLRASAIGAWLLSLRHVPVVLSGNIIQVPGHQLFVSEACSGLRSLTALFSLALLICGLWLQRPLARVGLLVATLPIAIIMNAIRVFLTGFLVVFVDPSLGDGFLHLTEGWVMFVLAFGCLGAVAWVISAMERRFTVAAANG